MTTPPPPEVEQIYNHISDGPRARILHMRALILAAGDATQASPLQECRKWGEPAFLPTRKGIGTTVRINWSPARSDVCSFYVSCNTNLLDQYRTHFPNIFEYHGNRQVAVPASGPFDDSAFQQMAAMALNYHRNKTGNT